MSQLKEQLIKLGSEHPDLRSHLRPVLDYIKQASFSLDQMLDEINDIMLDYYGWKQRGETKRSSFYTLVYTHDDYHEAVYVTLEKEEDDSFNLEMEKGQRGASREWEGVKQRGMMKTAIHRGMSSFFPDIKRAALKHNLIRIGSENPQLRDHLRSILSRLESEGI